MKPVIALIRERQWESAQWTDYFRMDNGIDPETALRFAVREFLSTSDGADAIRQTSKDFNWGDAVIYVPVETWAKYGLYPIEDPGTGYYVSAEIIVEQDEVLCRDFT